MRGNPLFWRIAKWLYCELLWHPENLDWDRADPYCRNVYYDKATVLYAKVINNDFTGPDDHD